MSDPLRVVMSLAFYPRGGSAQVVRYLAGALAERQHEITVCTGSLGPPGASSHAATFFGDLDTRHLDFTEAFRLFEQGGDPMAAPVPIHPSFEDRPGVPDRVFASLADDDYARQVSVWRALLERAGPADIHHVHHLTHINEAVRDLDDTPLVVHLHGTEMKMLGAIREGAPASWEHAEAWDSRLVAAARRADRLLVVSPSDHDHAVELLGVEEERVNVMPNGVDTDRFRVEPMPDEARMRRWHTWLVDEPAGWDESGVPGSVSYSTAQLEEAFLERESGEVRPVLIYVGRFLGFKRVPLLIRAYAEARQALGAAAPPLVVWGGHPGEWEGEHPHSVARSLGVEGVFFAGWRGHHDLSVALNCADVLVAPSYDEPFGQVYLEAMSCGLPVIGTRSGGPPSFVNTEPARPTGWLVTPDSRSELAAAIVEAAELPAERARRGRHGREVIERRFDWRRIAERIEQVYRELIATRR
jgi:glycosyltransferase involved in cell wall biosynthesis